MGTGQRLIEHPENRSLVDRDNGVLLDIVFDGPWILHQFLVNIAQNQNEYDLRGIPLVILVTLLLVILFVSLYFSLRLFRAKIGALGNRR